MPRLRTSLIRGAGVLCGLLLATSLYAQSNGQSARGRVNRMEIYNGLNRTVRYYGDNLSPGEESTLRELERSENELFYVRNLQTLKSQYVLGESAQDAYRRYVQSRLYGLDIYQTSSAGMAWAGSPWGGFGTSRYPYTVGLWPGAYTAYGASGYGGGFEGYFGDSASVRRSLAIGVGDEGRIKSSVAPVIAQQATQEYATSVLQAYEQVSMKASESPMLCNALGLTPPTLVARKRLQAVNWVRGPWVRLTLKDGSRIEGYSFDENKDWYIVFKDKDKSSQTRIRQSEVTRVDSGHSRSGIVPAARD